HLPELAWHFMRSPPENSAKACDYLARAGDTAMEALAYEDAVRFYESALDRQTRSAGRRCQLLISLAEATMRSGRTQPARRLFSKAFDLARGLRDGNLMARAVL